MKQTILSIILMLLPLLANAGAVEIDGIYYNLFNSAEVTINPNYYSGSVVIPEKVKYYGKEYSVTSIGTHAFKKCSGLTSVTIPNSVTSIGNDAFYDCWNLRSVHISDLVAWCKIDFWYESSNPLYFAHHLFMNSTEINDLVIPNSVTTIGNYAFSGCSGLTSVTIPNSVTSIGDEAFYGCDLTSVHISDLAAWCKIHFLFESQNPLYFAHHLFMNGKEINDLVIPNSVTTIGDCAFSGCSSLTSVTIPNSVKSIGDYAFKDCSSLTSVTIPNSVTSIGDYAFKDCSSLSSITIPNSVTSIGAYAFYKCSSLSSITIPNSVTSIGKSAFYGCEGLVNIYCYSDITFPKNVFTYTYYVEVDYDGPLDDETDDYHEGVEEEVTLTTTLRNATLYVKYALINDFKRLWNNFGSYISIDGKSVNGVIYLITDSVNNYAQVFGTNNPQNVINIEPSVEILGSLYKVTFIADNAFKDVESITSLVIPENVKDIGNNAFSGCRNLMTIELSKDVTTIGERAFANIDKLTDVICYAENVPETDRTAFENSYIDYVSLHVPAGSVEKYKNSAPWKDFKKIVAISGAEVKYTLTYMVDGVVYKTYELSEGYAITPEAAPTKDGYTFSGWSEIPETMPSHDITINGYFELNTNTTDLILCDNLQCISGSKPILKVGLTNTNEVKLCQFDLQLPAGVTVATKSNGKLEAKLTERAETHSVSSKQLENGNYRFVISSLDNDSFIGNSGTLIEITLDISPTMEAGEYIVKVINAELSVPDGNDLRVVKPADTESQLTINNYTPGDVNNDGSVSVTDVGCAINYILEQIPSVFVFEAADMNGDNTVSVTDVGMIINFILSDGVSSRRRAPERNDNENGLSPTITLQSTAEGYELRLEDKDAYVGFQFDLELSDDGVINGVQLNGPAYDDHQLTYRRLSNGKWRVVCYSPTNSTFSNGDSVLLTITATGSISVSDICLTTSELNELRPDNLFGMSTGIANVEKTNSKTTLNLYSLGGNIYRILNLRSGINSFDGLRPGIYLIDNKKIVIR